MTEFRLAIICGLSGLVGCAIGELAFILIRRYFR